MGLELENLGLIFHVCLFMNAEIVAGAVAVTDDIENMTKTMFWGRHCPLDIGMKFYFRLCSMSCLNFTLYFSVAWFA